MRITTDSKICPRALKRGPDPKDHTNITTRVFTDAQVQKCEKGLLLTRRLINRLLSLHPVQIVLILIFTKERRGGGLPLQHLHTGEKHLHYPTEQLSVQGGPNTTDSWTAARADEGDYQLVFLLFLLGW